MRKSYRGLRGNIVPIARNLMRPGYLPVVGRKALSRLRRPTSHQARRDAREWCINRAERLEDRLASIDPEIWAETERYAADATDRARSRLAELSIDFGGGGNYLLLYFLTRLAKPRTAVETGVALGWSSRAILNAMERNGFGRLLSSEFPAFRIENPDTYTGHLVEEAVRHRWEVFTAGDRANLPKMLPLLNQIDLFHYDSDKTYGGRSFATRLVRPYCGKQSIFIMDDVENDTFFQDWVESEGLSPSVFEFEGKYTGMVML